MNQCFWCSSFETTYNYVCINGVVENNTDQWTRDVGTFAHQTAAALPAAVTGTVAAATGSMALLALVALGLFYFLLIHYVCAIYTNMC